MNKFRVQHWLVFSKRYLLYDAEMQCPMLTGSRIAHYLLGKHKRIYAEGQDVGDFVVVVNCKNIAVRDNSKYWERFLYPKHTRFPRYRIDETMQTLHQRDPCDIIRKEIRANLHKGNLRKYVESRLFLHAGGLETVDKKLQDNISGIIKPVMDIPKKLSEYTESEKNEAADLFELPKDFVVGPLSSLSK